MSSRRITVLVAAALIAGMLALAGCAKPSITTQASSSTATATSQQATSAEQTSVEPETSTPIVASGPITTPASGSKERTALLDAARAKLGTGTQFYVYQLFVQGDTALGDLEPSTKSSVGRVFVAWERRGGVWTAIGASNFGTKAASAAATARALPSFSAEIIGKINWTLAKPKTSGTGSASSMKSSLSAAAKAWSKTAMSSKGSPYKVTVLKVAQDTKGVWWGHVVTQPTGDANNSYEPLNYWAKYSGGKWSGTLQDPEPPAPSTYFPSSVISKLSL